MQVMRNIGHYRSLWWLTTATRSSARFITAAGSEPLRLDDLGHASPLAGRSETVRDKVVLLATRRQLPSVLALIALDGVARRIVLFTPDLLDHVGSIVEEGEIDCVVSDGSLDLGHLPFPRIICHDALVTPSATPILRNSATEWVLFTSGTTGRPKMVSHTLASLSGPIGDGIQGRQAPLGAVWSTFYDVRRYGGLQILLRALIGGGSMVLSDGDEPVAAFLARLRAAGVTHLSGTPSHWRRAIMSGAAGSISPRYVRLSGEAADQGVLDQLREYYPRADIAHAFASTEAGVGFDVRDGVAGFPAAFIPHPNGNTLIELAVVDGTLRIRSSRRASRYLAGHALAESDGFIDTGDLVERKGDRFYFMGRREGVINVGGQKVFPEEVENVVTQHPAVAAARVWSRPSPVTGAVVAADVVLHQQTVTEWADVRGGLIDLCAQALPRYKIPVSWRQVGKIEMTVSGKVRRR